MPNIRLDLDINKIVSLYKKGLGAKKIGELMFVDKMTITSRLKEIDFPMRRKGRPRKELI